MVDDALPDHRKVRKLRDEKLAAVGLWTLCGSWCCATLSDGFVPLEVVRRFDPEEIVAKRLCDVGLWGISEDDGETGYRFHDWDEYQLSSQRVRKKKADNAARQRAFRERRSNALRVTEDESVTAGEVDFAVTHDVVDSVISSNGAGPADRNALHNVVRNEGSNSAPTPPHPHKEKTSRRGASDDPDFARFYDAYGKKREPQNARKAWRKAIKDGADPEQIIAATAAYRAQCATEGRDITHVKYPASWLNAGGYLDEYGPVPASSLPPDEHLRQLWRTEDARAVASLVGRTWIEPNQPPDDPLPRAVWLQKARRAFIEQYHDAALAALGSNHD